MRKIIFLSFLFLFFPFFVFSGEYIANIKGTTTTISYEGLVPCGECLHSSVALLADELTSTTCGYASGTWTNTFYVPCQFCHLFVMFDNIVDFLLFKIIVPLAILFFAAGGIMYVLAFFEFVGGPQLLGRAKSVLFATIVGVVIAFSAWGLINLFFMLVGIADWTGLGKWWQINCTIEI
jgi:hypothetical protein